MLAIHKRWRTALLLGNVLGLAPACRDEPAQYPPPTYIDYTKQPPYAAAQAPPHQSGAPPPQSNSNTATDQNPTIGDALAPFGIVLPPNISLLKLPPPTAWQNWPFTWPNLPASPAPPPVGNPPAATPTPVPSPAPPSPALGGFNEREQRVLLETNRRRAQGASCGGERLPPAPPLQPSRELAGAARAHSTDMAQNNYFDHTSLDGRTVDQRTRAAGFPGRFVGENIAAGRASPEATVQQWMESPGHCLNIMEPKYRFLGVGYAASSTQRLTHFWTQNFGG